MLQTNKTKIVGIIEIRKPLVKKIDQVKNNLGLLIAKLHELINYRDEILSKKGDSPELSGLSVDTILKQIDERIRNLNKLRIRFNRETLNIGIIGRARQGKSRLLRSLTGLSQLVIPDGSGTHCTGVRSTIYHKLGVKTHAEVVFHTENSFLHEIIHPYYKALNLPRVPSTLSEFQHVAFDKIESNGAVGNAQLTHLKKYQSKIEDYKDWLSHASPYRVEEDDIPKFVAQYHPITQEVYSNYLAVKEVKIYCSFPNDEIGQVALVDMPGLGDTGVGDAARLIETLGQDVDMIAFVRMPKHTGDHWADHDVSLYDTASEALKEIPIEQWSCMVLNQLADGSNIANCIDLEKSISDHHIQVSRLLKADCSNSEAANNLVLTPILEYMANHISSLDQKYASSHQHQLDYLSKSIQEFHKLAKTSLGSSGISSSEHRAFKTLFESFWKELTKGVNNLREQLAEERNKSDSNLENALDEAVISASKSDNLPSEQDIRDWYAIKGSYEAAYTAHLDWLRNRLTMHFQSLDAGLDKSIQEVKIQLATILQNAGLISLNNETGMKFLKNFYETHVKQWEDAKNLQQGFEDIIEFTLRYRMLIHHRIRQHLDILTPDFTEYRLPQLEQYQGKNHAIEVVKRLESAYAEARYKIEGVIRSSILCEPRMAIFAMVEEFGDRTLLAERAKEEWENNLSDIKHLIWPLEFKLQGLLDDIQEASTMEKFSLS